MIDIKCKPRTGSVEGSARLPILGVLVLLACISGVLLGLRGVKPEPQPVPVEDSGPAVPIASQTSASNHAVPHLESAGTPSVTTTQALVQTRPEPSPLTRQLVSGLTTFDPNTALTPERIAIWKTSLADLVKQGPAGVAAIQEFLEKNVDFTFSAENAQQLGYPTVRSAMFDALGQIGGAEGVGGLLSVLKDTADPKEIAWLIQVLERVEPGVHAPSAIGAAREALQMAAAGNLADRDVAPLFEVMQFYGDASTASELEKSASRWGYYATTALANLPDNAGLPSLMKMADPDTASPNRTVALQMIAQLAGTSEGAREFLMAQIKEGKIPEKLWPYLKSPLSGEQYYPMDAVITQYPSLPSLSELKRTRIPYGNQNLYTLPTEAALTPEGLNRHIAFVDQLLALTSDPTAARTLEQAKSALNKRLIRANRAATQPVSGEIDPEG